MQNDKSHGTVKDQSYDQVNEAWCVFYKYFYCFHTIIHNFATITPCLVVLFNNYYFSMQNSMHTLNKDTSSDRKG